MEHFNFRKQAIKNKVSSIIDVLDKGYSEENIKEAYKILIDRPKEQGEICIDYARYKLAEYIYENRVTFTSSYIISDDYFETINKPYELITGISNNFNNINVELLLKLDKNLKQELITINKKLKQNKKAVKETDDDSKNYKSLKQFVKCNKDKKNRLSQQIANLKSIKKEITNSFLNLSKEPTDEELKKLDTNITKLVTTKTYPFDSPETKDEFLYNIIEKSLGIEGEDVAIKSWEMFQSIDLKKIVKKHDVFYDNNDYMTLGQKVLQKLQDTRDTRECILNFLDDLDIEQEDEEASLETVEKKNRKRTIKDRENNSEENYEFQSKRSCDKHNQQYTTDSKNLNDTINSFSFIEPQGQGKKF